MPRPLAIIIPCRNEERYIGRCLDSVLANDYDHRLLDIVVVDGMSTDRTREIVAEYARKYPCVRLLDNPDKIKPTALNLGIANTSADVVMRIDAHSLYDTQYIPILVEGLYKHDCDNIGGIRETEPGDTVWSRAIAHAISHPFSVGNALYRTGVTGDEPREVDTVFCGCYRRRVFERIGLFNEKLIRTQDREFNERLRAIGGKIILVPQARCSYFPRTPWSTYCKWNYQGSYWLYYASRFTDTKMKSWRNLLPAGFVLWHILALIMAFTAPVLAAVMAAPIVFYWMLNAFVSVKTAMAENAWTMAPALMLLFATTHYGYGLGALHGGLAALWQGKDVANCSPERIPEFVRKAA
ncbi:MAG: glycosyltransferase family 2 protein [Planctomycetaceae bacterium]|nr:glycosyltransferase family 2 protein [Planctomycetaceae bacterium]